MQFFPPHLLAQHAVSTVHKPILAERFKTKMCQNYEREGFCPYEARCMFAHGGHELRTKEMNYRDNLVTEEAIREFLAIRTSPAIAAHYDGRSILAERFKTKLCQNYERAGECTFEHRCMFAHGEDDLRTKEMNIEDGLLTEEAIKDFQNAQAAAARDADRRRKRNQKKKAKLQAAKEARKQLQPATVADAAEPRSADGSGSEGGPQLAPCTLREEPLSAHQRTTLEVSVDVKLQSMNSVISFNGGSSTDCLSPHTLRRRHNPYAPVVIGAAEAYLSRSADGSFAPQHGVSAVSFAGGASATESPTPAVTPPPVLRRRSAPTHASLFPLASVLQMIRRRNSPPSESSAATSTSTGGASPLVALPPAREQLSANHTILFA
jgi:hypothetical protein